MANVRMTVWGHQLYNDGWGILESTTYQQDAAEVINALWEEFGDTLWNCIENTSDTVTTILVHRKYNGANRDYIGDFIEVEYVIREEVK